jgi:hypothetical protein
MKKHSNKKRKHKSKYLTKKRKNKQKTSWDPNIISPVFFGYPLKK